MRRPAIPEPLPLDWTMGTLDSAEITAGFLPHGRYRQTVRHAPLHGFTPAMRLWFLERVGRPLTWRGDELAGKDPDHAGRARRGAYPRAPHGPRLQVTRSGLHSLKRAAAGEGSRREPGPSSRPRPPDALRTGRWAHGYPRLYDILGHLLFMGRRRNVFRRLAALSGAAPGERVLDVGCGTGYFTRILARTVAPEGSALGIDPSTEALARARRLTHLSNCSFRQDVAEALDAGDAWFDVVVSSLMMHHLPEELRSKAIAGDVPSAAPRRAAPDRRLQAAHQSIRPPPHPSRGQPRPWSTTPSPCSSQWSARQTSSSSLQVRCRRGSTT
jgi:hypothetical protein